MAAAAADLDHWLALKEDFSRDAMQDVHCFVGGRRGILVGVRGAGAACIGIKPEAAESDFFSFDVVCKTARPVITETIQGFS